MAPVMDIQELVYGELSSEVLLKRDVGQGYIRQRDMAGIYQAE